MSKPQEIISEVESKPVVVSGSGAATAKPGISSASGSTTPPPSAETPVDFPPKV